MQYVKVCHNDGETFAGVVSSEGSLMPATLRVYFFGHEASAELSQDDRNFAASVVLDATRGVFDGDPEYKVERRDLSGVRFQVGELWQAIDNEGRHLPRFNVRLDIIDVDVPLDQGQMDQLGVPRGVLRPSWAGYLGKVFTDQTTGESVFVAE